MSKGKYSPNLPTRDKPFEYFDRNCYGKIPEEYKSGDDYDPKTMFADHDSEGYDMYGYSSFDWTGRYVGNGNGIDRNGYTEMDYLMMTDEEFYNL